MLGKEQLRHMDAYKVRAVAKGSYRGVKSTREEEENAEHELKLRGLSETKSESKSENKRPVRHTVFGDFDF